MFYKKEEETIDRDAIRRIQDERFVKQVRYAFENVELYRKRFEEAGITPDDITGTADAHKIPFTYKNDLRDHYPYGILAVPIEKVQRFHASSGTTGIPTVVSYTENDIDTWEVLMARSIAAAGCTSEDIVQNAYGYGLFTGGLGFHQGAQRLGCAVIPAGTGTTKKQLGMIKDMKVTALACTPSYALYLSEVAEKEGFNPETDFNLKFGLFGAEPWSEESRKKIQEGLGIRATDFYGMSELYGPGVAVECENQNGLHINEDFFLVETIDPDTGDVIPNGQLGEIVFTMLTREAMPLLRYRTRDRAVINEEPCSCGRSFARIMRISGRTDDMLIVGGVNVFPSQIEEVLFKTPEVGDNYQIIVDREQLDRLYVKVELSEEAWADASIDRDALMKKVEAEMISIITVRPRLEFIAPGTIPRGQGKAQRVVDLRK